MEQPYFSIGEYLGQNQFNSMADTVQGAIETANSVLSSPGLINSSDLSLSASGLTLNISAPLPFWILFSNGILASANGTTNGQTSDSATVDCSSFVPSSGSVTVYIIATASTVYQNPYTVVGPSPGSPDYNPLNAPSTQYSVVEDTLVFSATETAPNNTTNMEICRFTLSAGQTTITNIDTSYQVIASSILAPTGVTPGVYDSPNITIGADGRVSSASSNPNLATQDGNNTFTGNNTFSGGVTLTADSDQQLVINGGNNSDGANFVLEGGGTNGTFWFNASNDNTLSVYNNSFGNTILSLSDTGELTPEGGLVIPSGQTLTNNGTITGGSLENVTVPSSQTITVDGTLDVTGTITVQNATSDNQPVALGQFPFSVGAGANTSTGYIKFPNGIILQWGAITTNGSSSGQTVTYPIAFPNAMFISEVSDQGIGMNTGALVNLSNSQGTAYAGTAANTYSATGLGWIAVGY